jgi:hypothetical protein
MTFLVSFLFFCRSIKHFTQENSLLLGGSLIPMSRLNDSSRLCLHFVFDCALSKNNNSWERYLVPIPVLDDVHRAWLTYPVNVLNQHPYKMRPRDAITIGACCDNSLAFGYSCRVCLILYLSMWFGQTVGWLSPCNRVRHTPWPSN